MKKLLLIIVSVCILFAGACEKKDKGQLNLDPPKKNPLEGPGNSKERPGY